MDAPVCVYLEELTDKFYADIGCRLEDQPGTIADRGEWLDVGSVDDDQIYYLFNFLSGS